MAVSFSWNTEKSDELRKTRGLSFEQVVAAIDAGGLLDDVENPSGNFSGQRALVVAIEGYAVVVPYVTDADGIFLKTAFRSRRAKRIYMPHGGEDNG